MDYEEIFTQIGQCIQYTLPIGIAWGLCERLVSFVLDVALDRVRKNERI